MPYDQRPYSSPKCTAITEIAIVVWRIEEFGERSNGMVTSLGIVGLGGLSSVLHHIRIRIDGYKL
jgi:hypothetical protein